MPSFLANLGFRVQGLGLRQGTGVPPFESGACCQRSRNHEQGLYELLSILGLPKGPLRLDIGHKFCYCSEAITMTMIPDKNHCPLNT